MTALGRKLQNKTLVSGKDLMCRATDTRWILPIRSPSMPNRRTRYALLFLLAFIAGCGSGSPYKYTKVSGKVTYEDGSPIPGGLRLRFEALDAPAVEKAHPRPAIANVN